jgi:hypothetical protein
VMPSATRTPRTTRAPSGVTMPAVRCTTSPSPATRYGSPPTRMMPSGRGSRPGRTPSQPWRDRRGERRVDHRDVPRCRTARLRGDPRSPGHVGPGARPHGKYGEGGVTLPCPSRRTSCISLFAHGNINRIRGDRSGTSTHRIGCLCWTQVIGIRYQRLEGIIQKESPPLFESTFFQ